MGRDTISKDAMCQFAQGWVAAVRDEGKGEQQQQTTAAGVTENRTGPATRGNLPRATFTLAASNTPADGLDVMVDMEPVNSFPLENQGGREGLRQPDLAPESDDSLADPWERTMLTTLKAKRGTM